MILSPRYAWPLLVVLLVGAVPMVAGTLAPRRVDDCADPAAMQRLAEAGWAGEVTERSERHRSGHVQWTEGVVATRPGSEDVANFSAGTQRSGTGRKWWSRGGGAPGETPSLSVRVVRSFNPFYLRQRATTALNVQLVPDNSAVMRVATPFGDLVVHVLRKYAASKAQVVVYTYIFEGQSVEMPILAEAAALPSTLLHGARPVTLLLASASRDHGYLEPAVTEAIAWLGDAWGYYQAVCQP